MRRIDPEVAARTMRAAGLEPLVPYPGSNTPWPCRCTSCGADVSPRYHGIQAGQGGCRQCGIEKRAESHRHDPEWAAELMRNAGYEPLVPYPGSMAPWPCRCMTCGAECGPVFVTVQGGRGGCLSCGYAKMRDKQRGDGEKAAAVMRAAGLDPLEPYPGARTPWRCRCTSCGNDVWPRYNNVQQQSGGCRFCGRGQYAGAPARVYLIVHDEFDAAKVGITKGIRSKRVPSWERAGWQVVGIWHFADGADAMRAEDAVLDYWRNEMQAPFGLSAIDVGIRGGHTETAPLYAIDLSETVRRIDRSA